MFRRRSSRSRLRRWWRGLLAPLRRTPSRLNALWNRWSGQARRRAVIARMLPGDIVLASPRLRRLSLTAVLYRLLLRSRYVHAMLYLGDRRIIHTTARDGVTMDRLPGKLFDRDRYRIRRVAGLSPEQRAAVVAEAQSLLDHRLDHVGLVTNIPARWLGLPNPLWHAERNRLWCGKLIHTAYARHGIELVPEAEPGTITSEDLARSRTLVDI